MWIDLKSNGRTFVWHLEWPADICAELVSWSNPCGRITNSDLELAELVLYEAYFPYVCSAPSWNAPATGSDNTTTVSWSFREASSVNLVVVDLLRLRSAQNWNSKITPSVFYHPGPKNTMADDASRQFDISDKASLSLFSSH